MNDRLTIEQGDIMTLLSMVKDSNWWEGGRTALQPSWVIKAVNGLRFRLDRASMARRAKRNVAHHY